MVLAPRKQQKRGIGAKPRRKLPNTVLMNVWWVAKMVAGFALLPLWPVFLSVGSRDPYYVNHYFETIWHSLRTVKNAIRTFSITRIFKYNLFTSPRTIEERLAVRLGACTRCAKCCKMLQCDFLAYNRENHEYYCTVYNTPYWFFGDCGRYPIDQQDIDAYNCPGFSFPESVAAAAQDPALTGPRSGPPGSILQIGKL